MNSKIEILTNQEFIYGTKTINFSLIQNNRKTLRIEVLPTMEVVVKAPSLIGLEIINEKIKKRSKWILKQIQYFNDFHPRITPRKYISGETFLYLGRQYILKTEIVTKNEGVKLKGKFILVYLKKLENTEKILNNWYLKNAQEKIKIYSEGVLKNFENLDLRPNKISLKSMKTRWGSCSKKGNITINTDLVRAPRGCIEYVLTHELCHLIEFGHTKSFYELQTKQMSDWQKWKNKLERLLA